VSLQFVVSSKLLPTAGNLIRAIEFASDLADDAVKLAIYPNGEQSKPQLVSENCSVWKMDKKI
jgi:hypothetical protein